MHTTSMAAKAKAKAVVTSAVAAKAMAARANMLAKENGATKSNIGSTRHRLRVTAKATGKAVFSLGHGARGHGDRIQDRQVRIQDRRVQGKERAHLRRLAPGVRGHPRSAAKLAVSFPLAGRQTFRSTGIAKYR